MICSKVDNFYRNLIRCQHNYGDKALLLLKTYCANCTLVDKNHFHREFTNLQILQDENATHFLKQFTIGKSKAVIADNTYLDNKTVDLLLAAMNATKNVQYLYVVQHFLSERDANKFVRFDDIERRLLAIDELSERECHTSRKAQPNLGYNVSQVSSTIPQLANATSGQPIKCYNCGKEGHIAPNCPHPKRERHSQRGDKYRGGKDLSGRQTDRNLEQYKLQRQKSIHDKYLFYSAIQNISYLISTMLVLPFIYSSNIAELHFTHFVLILRSLDPS